MIVYLTVAEGVILRIPKGIGSLANIRPRAIDAQHKQFITQEPYQPGPDLPGNILLDSNELLIVGGDAGQAQHPTCGNEQFTSPAKNDLSCTK
jgi:hypothetical protein